MRREGLKIRSLLVTVWCGRLDGDKNSHICHERILSPKAVTNIDDSEKVTSSAPEIFCSSKTKHHLDIVLFQIILIDDLNVRTIFVNIFSQSEIFEKFSKFYELMISALDALVFSSG